MTLSRRVMIALPVVAAALVSLMAAPASAEPAPTGDSAYADALRSAMKSARWTGPLLASSAEALPQGHVYTEPYFFYGISGGDHHPGTSGFYQYGTQPRVQTDSVIPGDFGLTFENNGLRARAELHRAEKK